MSERKAARTAIDAAAALAGDVDLPAVADDLRQLGAALDRSSTRIVVLGRFKNGKSTLINSLLAATTTEVDLPGRPGPLPVGILPTTGVLTRVHYATSPFCVVHNHDGRRETWSLEQFLERSPLGPDDVENQRRLGGIREFEVGYPAALCASDVAIFDTPGLDDIPIRQMITHREVRRSDVAIVVFRGDALMGNAELGEIRRLLDGGTRAFVVVTLLPGQEPDDNLRSFVWNRYVRDHLNGPPWSQQDLAERDIYLIEPVGDRRDGAGFTGFERRLSDFVAERSRQTVHRHAAEAATFAARAAEVLAGRHQAAVFDSERLAGWHAQVQPLLDAANREIQALDGVFHGAQGRMERLLADSFTDMVADVRADLPGHLQQVSFRSERVTAAFTQQRLILQVTEEISRFVSDRVTAWADTTAPELLDPELAILTRGVRDRLDQVNVLIDRIVQDLDSSYRGRAGADVVTDLRMQMIMEGFEGTVPSAVDVGVWAIRSAAVARVAGSAVLSALGGMSMILFWPVALGGATLAVLVGSGLMSRRIRAKAYAEADARLRAMPSEVIPVIREHLETWLGDRQESAVALGRGLVAGARQNVDRVVAMGGSTEEGPGRAAVELEAKLSHLDRCRRDLQAVVDRTADAPVDTA